MATELQRAITEISAVRGSGGDGDLHRVRDDWDEFLFVMEKLQNSVADAYAMRNCHYNELTGYHLRNLKDFVKDINMKVHGQEYVYTPNWSFISDKPKE